MTIDDIEKMALDGEIAEALARDAELDAHPESALSLKQLDDLVATRPEI